MRFLRLIDFYALFIRGGGGGLWPWNASAHTQDETITNDNVYFIAPDKQVE